MVVKFFSNKKGGSSKAIDYLLNQREKEGTAKVLKGDSQITRSIINSMTFKQKATVGVLSFEEKNISLENKLKIMEDFEKHLLPGMQDRYNILWVEHTDKNMTELNFVIPKIDLETQKSLNPYYHSADLPRVDKWQDLQNLEYGFSSPKDPSKTRTMETHNLRHLNKDYKKLDMLLHKLIEDGKVNNREQLIGMLSDNDIEVTRAGKDYISVKLPDSKKARKFKGGIYSEEFRSIGSLREVSKRTRTEIEQYNSRDTRKEITELRTELNSFVQDKSQKLRKQYPRTKYADNQEHILRTREIESKKELEMVSTRSSRNTSNTRSSNILHNNSSISKENKSNLLFLEDGREIDNDSIRESIIRGITSERKDYNEAYNKARHARSELFKSLERSYTGLQERAGQIRGEQQKIIEQSRVNLGKITDYTRPISGLSRIGNKLKELYRDTRELIINKLRKVLDKAFQSNIKTESKIEIDKFLDNQPINKKLLNKCKIVEERIPKLEKDNQIVNKPKVHRQRESRGMSMSR